MTKILTLENPFAVKPYTKGELVKLYRPISLYILNKWLKEIEPLTGPIRGRTLSIKQVLILIEKFGLPKQFINEVA
ncbi:MAG: hypothetical protein ACXVNR_13005 [Bacteroidia bacterium]